MKNRLREIRKALKLTQKDLADMAGVSRTTIISVEHGMSPIKSDTISAIVRAVQVPANEIFFDFDVVYTQQKGEGTNGTN